LCLRNLVQRTYAIDAMPMGAPGWPELAFWTPSTARKRIVLIALLSSSEVKVMLGIPF